MPTHKTVQHHFIKQSRPISGGNLVGMLEDFWHYLEKSLLWTEVSVKSTEEAEYIVLASCKANATAQAQEIALELERIWAQSLCYQSLESHSLRISQELVVLEGITVPDGGGYFATAHILVQMGTTPPHREAHERTA